MTEINKRIEEGAKKLCLNDGLDWGKLPESGYKNSKDREYYRRCVRQICQLFPQPLEDKELEKELVEILGALRHSCEYDHYDFHYDAVLDAKTKISALLQPKIEEAKKQCLEEWMPAQIKAEKMIKEEARRQEGERIDDLFQTFVSHLTKVTRTTYALGLEDARWFRQVLKGGE